MSLPSLLDQVDDLLAKKEDAKLKKLLTELDDTDIAEIIEELPSGKRKVFAMLPPEKQAEVVVHLSERTTEYLLQRLTDDTIARFLHFNEEDDAADLIQHIPEERRDKVTVLLKREKKKKIEKLLSYDPQSAGGLMDLNFIMVDAKETFKDVLEKIRTHSEEEKQAPIVVVNDAKKGVMGFIPYKTILLTPATRTVALFASPLPLVSPQMDQEDVLDTVTKERSDMMGVVDEKQQFLGVIHLQDLLRIAEKEATEDVYQFAGVNKEEEMLDSPWTAIRLRRRWLNINIVSAFAAATVISFFEGTISQIAILAAFMPIVAGVGGNAGTQALAVVVRGIALGDFNRKYMRQILWKEAVTGLVNGLINGGIVFIIVTLIWRNPLVGGILALAMIINMLLAGVMGALIPIILKLKRIDPAVASTVFLTTTTDICGFLAFLGLATVALRYFPQ
jgi:magnesium transporter